MGKSLIINRYLTGIRISPAEFEAHHPASLKRIA